MKSRPVVLTVVAIAILLAVSVFACVRGQAAPRRHDMIAKAHWQQTSSSTDELLAKIDATKESNDPVQLRTALGDVKNSLGEIKEQGRMLCADMMSMRGCSRIVNKR